MVEINEDARRMIEEIINRRETAVVYYSRKGLVVATQSTKIQYRDTAQSNGQE